MPVAWGSEEGEISCCYALAREKREGGSPLESAEDKEILEATETDCISIQSLKTKIPSKMLVHVHYRTLKGGSNFCCWNATEVSVY